MNYEQAMTGAEEAGTVRRNKRRILYRRIVWSLGTVVFAYMTIYWKEGPLEKYVAYRDTKAVAEAAQAVTTTVQASRTCPEMSMSEVRSCDITADEWTPWVRLESGARDTTHKVCASYGVKSERTDEGGATKFRYRANSGKDKVKYQVVPLETDCIMAGF